MHPTPEQPVLSQIYLDANATTPVLPQAAEAALSTMKTQFGNPSSSHITGLQAKEIMDNTRSQAKEVLGAGNGQVIFTSGATEGIQTAIISALCEAKKSLDGTKNYTLLYGATEHKAVPESLKHWNSLLEINAQVKAIPVDSTGKLDIDFIAQEAPNALMICTMAVNNETGVFQDVALLDKTIRANNPSVFWMVDCVQALGKTSLNLAKTTIDYAPFSGHKLYAPKGIGFVYIKENAPFTPFIAGGGQEGGLRSGTENLPGLAALSVIFDLLTTDNETFAGVEQLKAFRLQLTAALTQAFPHIVFNHHFENSVATTLNFAIPGFSSKEIMDLFDAANIRVSSGSACSSKVTRSFVLDAMGLPQWQSESAIRMSFGPAITQEQIDNACERIITTAGALSKSCLTLDPSNIDNKTELSGLLQFKVGGSCTWLYVDKATKSAIIVDPLPQISQRLMTLLSCQGLTLSAVIDTHGHADHQSCRSVIAKEHLATQVADSLGWPVGCESMELNGQVYEYLTIGEHRLIRVPTPGHTQDSISLLLGQAEMGKALSFESEYAFCGDMILMGSLGRTNFPCSSAQAMYQSLGLLNSLLGESTLLCPSHDYNNEFTTSVAAEMERNTLLKQVIEQTISQSSFAIAKAKLDAHIQDEQGCEIVCGAFIEPCEKDVITEYRSESLAKAMASDANIQLIDIREPHEYVMSHDPRFAQNIPLNRLVQFIQSQYQDKQREIVLVCRSGSRSQVAAQALVRLGFANVGHLQGGYALN